MDTEEIVDNILYKALLDIEMVKGVSIRKGKLMDIMKREIERNMLYKIEKKSK
jgi:hypothetical protein